jgi:hypothetical protein
MTKQHGWRISSTRTAQSRVVHILTVTVNKTNLANAMYRLDSSSVTLGGVIKDLYDFDYDADTVGSSITLNRWGAILQAGWGTLGNAGHVFKIEANLSGTAPVPMAFNYQ